jgi:dTDP-4-amino-4,6-dideoxygalactose transaminase
MRVSFLDLRRLHCEIEAELRTAIDRIVSESAFVGGEGEEFESEFAAACGAGYSAGCNSGTDALSLSLRVLGIGPGDEVIVPSMTFFATVEAVLHVGATPVVADVDHRTLMLTSATSEPAISDRTRVVIPVHLYGSVVDPVDIREWRKRGLRVVEDAAQAHLAHAEGTPVGTMGDMAAFSFFPGKNLGAFGDAGAVVSNDAEAISRVRRIRNHGRTSKFVHDEVGVSSRLDGLQAAVLRVKLRHLPRWTANRRELARAYDDLLGGISGVSVVPWGGGAVHHLLPIRVAAEVRDEVRSALSASGVETGLHYPVPLSRQPGLNWSNATTPHADAASSELISLPLDPLMSAKEVEYVCHRLDEVLTRLGAGGSAKGV